jgi:glycosyltransferase involved in cell wall biosynthesis
MNVSVVVRSYNESAHIGRLMAGLRKQTVLPKQVVLVDSGSTDGTMEVAARHDVEIIEVAPEDFSYGRSLNLGCGAATGDLIVIASAHVYPVFDTWLEHLIAPFEDPRVALTYGRQIGDRTTKYSEHQVLAKWFPDRSAARQGHPFCNNANAAIRADLWAQLPYDESLTGLEDMDWAKRALERDLAVTYVAESPVVHLHDESPRQIANRYRREAIAHRRIFSDQEMRFLDAARLAVANILADYYHATREGLLLPNLVGIPVFRAAQFWGAYRGFRQRGPVSDALRQHFYYPRSRTRVGAPGPGNPGRPIRYEAQSGGWRAEID